MVKVKILFICYSWPGLRESYNEGKEPNGMPGFYYLLKELSFRKYSIDLFIYTPDDFSYSFNHMPKDHWFSAINIKGIYKIKQLNGLSRIIYEYSLIYLMNREINTLLDNNHYDFIYGQGNYSECGRNAAIKHGIPFAMRKYGDDFAPLVNQIGIIQASLRSPISALSYLTKKEFILATNDGTEIDKLAKRFRRHFPYKLYVWNNGFDNCIGLDDKFIELTKQPFIFQFSRINRLKGQSDVLDIFKLARNKGFNGNLIIAGNGKDTLYFEELNRKITEYNIRDYVFFIGTISSEQANFLSQYSVANIRSGINYNLNNVFIESLGYGAIVLVRDTPLITEVIINKSNGFIFRDVNECSNILVDLYNNKYDSLEIRKRAKETCTNYFGSWEDRIHREINLIEAILKK